MPRLLNRFELAAELNRLINDAEDFLTLISPYFKLNTELKTILSRHKANKDFLLIVVYGKNEEDKRKSLSDEDLAFFKEFQNVEIRYHKRLHAKMYLNEEKCLITSLNLHDYSLKENIEVGILTKTRLMDDLVNLVNTISKNLMQESLDTKAAEFAEYIVGKSTLEFEKKVKQKSHFFGLINTNDSAEVLLDKSRTGFCIRTKQVIPRNTKIPLSKEAYRSWEKHANKSFKENYCHYCGKEYATSMAKPICIDCYNSSKRK